MCNADLILLTDSELILTARAADTDGNTGLAKDLRSELGRRRVERASAPPTPRIVSALNRFIAAHGFRSWTVTEAGQQVIEILMPFTNKDRILEERVIRCLPNIGAVRRALGY
jgi:hypothetical protein